MNGRNGSDPLPRSLRRARPTPPPERLPPLDGVREIARYYAGLHREERLLLLARAKKEESGIGTIPLALSAISFAGLLFGSRIHEPLARYPVWTIYTIWSIAGLFLITGFYLHQRQKAYTTLHIVLLEQAIKADEERSRPSGQVHQHQFGLGEGDDLQPVQPGYPGGVPLQ